MMAGLEPDDPYSRTINATEIFKYISTKIQLTMY